MRIRLHAAILAATFIGGSAALTVSGEDIALIGNQDIAIDEIDTADLRAVFLGSKTSLLNRHVHPVLNSGGGALAEFSSRRLGKSAAALKTYYRSLVFTGKWSTPLSFSSDEQTVEYVARTSGAIGFVRSGAALRPGVKLLRVR